MSDWHAATEEIRAKFDREVQRVRSDERISISEKHVRLARAWTDAEAATTQLLFGPPGSQIGTGGYSRPDQGDRQRLWDTGYAMQPPNDFSRINQGRKELIDHILVSHALIGALQDAGTVSLDIPSIGTQPQTTPRTTPPSDHRPVLAHFDL